MSLSPEPLKMLRVIVKKFPARAMEYLFQKLAPGGRKEVPDYVRLMIHSCAALLEGKIPGRRLIINAPPRHFKSVTGTVLLALAALIKEPRMQILIICHTLPLARQHIASIRDFFDIPEVAILFPELKISPDKDTQDLFRTKSGGQIRAASIDSQIAGFAADLVMVDDPNDPSSSYHSDQLTKVFEFYTGSALSRLNNPRESLVIITQHRVAIDDLTGSVLPQGGYEHLVLPVMAREPIGIAYEGGVFERKVGEILDPEINDEATIARKRLENPRMFEALFNQDPRLGPKAILDQAWLKPLSEEVFGKIKTVSIDPASSSSDNASHTAYQLWNLVDGKHTLSFAASINEEFGPVCDRIIPLLKRHRADVILIENTSIGPALKDVIVKAGLKNVHLCNRSVGKIQALESCLGYFTSGTIQYLDGQPWTQEVITQWRQFPACRRDDHVDALTQYLLEFHDSPKKFRQLVVSDFGRSRGGANNFDSLHRPKGKLPSFRRLYLRR